jgi:hypothetical protein
VSVIALCLLSGCKKPNAEDQGQGPTAPWRADEATTDAIDRSLLMRLAGGQHLDFLVGSREVPLAGTVPVLSAELQIDPHALEHVRGELSFGVGGLSVRQEGDRVLADETSSARRALGLGKEMAQAERERFSQATLRILSARDLSARAISRGKKLSEGGREVRRVLATVEAELLLREIEVHHRLRVQLDFVRAGSGSSEGTVEELRVTLLASEPVSLVEHDIVPRDEAGRLVAEQLEGFRKTLAGSVKVSGELLFRRDSTENPAGS